MRNEGRGSQNSLVTRAQRNRGAGPTPLLLRVCAFVCVCVSVSLRTGLPEGGVVFAVDGRRGGGLWWTLCVCLEREIRVGDHCWRRSRTHTTGATVSCKCRRGALHHPTAFSLLIFFLCLRCTFFFNNQGRLMPSWNNGFYRDFVKICD